MGWVCRGAASAFACMRACTHIYVCVVPVFAYAHVTYVCVQAYSSVWCLCLHACMKYTHAFVTPASPPCPEPLPSLCRYSATYQGVDLTQYNHRVLILPRALPTFMTGSCSFSGLALVGSTCIDRMTPVQYGYVFMAGGQYRSLRGRWEVWVGVSLGQVGCTDVSLGQMCVCILGQVCSTGVSLGPYARWAGCTRQMGSECRLGAGQ